MTRIELHDADRDPAHLTRAASDPDAVFFSVADLGEPVGTAALFSVDGARGLELWIAPDARGRGVGTAVLEQLIAREPERPLYARATADDLAAIAALERVGFIRASIGGGDDLVYALVPNYDGY